LRWKLERSGVNTLIWVRTGILDTGIIPVSVGPSGIPVSRLPTGIGQWDKFVTSIVRSMVRIRHVGSFISTFCSHFAPAQPWKRFFVHISMLFTS